MKRPKLVCPNFISETRLLREFALDHGFDGVEWTLTPEDLSKPTEIEALLADAVTMLKPLPVRYHLSFKGVELGDRDAQARNQATSLSRRAIRVASRLGGGSVTVHVGLGLDSLAALSWDLTVDGLQSLSDFARRLGVRICLENLAWGWTSHPHLYEKLIRKAGVWGTLDIGHAQVSPSVLSGAYRVEDFVIPHSARIAGAHVYHEETMDGHVPPRGPEDLESRLKLLTGLPLCDWWVLELREEAALRKTLGCVREFFLWQAFRAAV